MSKLIYISGLSGSGKTTLGIELQRRIRGSILLDGDMIRSTINKDLGYEKSDKIENIRRNNALIKMLYDQDFTVICCFMASIEDERDKIFKLCENALRIQLTTSKEVCIARNVKGLYTHKINNFAGVNAIYTPLNNPNISIDTSKLSVSNCVDMILITLERLS